MIELGILLTPTRIINSFQSTYFPSKALTKALLALYDPTKCQQLKRVGYWIHEEDGKRKRKKDSLVEHGMDTGIGNLNMELNWENVATIKVNASVPTSLDNLGGKPNVECACLVDNQYVASPPTVIASTLEPVSFATLLKGDPSQKSINFHPLLALVGNGADVVISKESTPDVNIMKEGVCNIPIWVKFHDIPITAFTKDGLSTIANKLGTPLMLDSYTAAMYTDSYGRSSYARAMVELRADVELKDTIVSIKDSMDQEVEEAQQVNQPIFRERKCRE
ncbi:ribonuclease H-like domain-containing protein [Tanacetum coccineum]